MTNQQKQNHTATTNRMCKPVRAINPFCRQQPAAIKLPENFSANEVKTKLRFAARSITPRAGRRIAGSFCICRLYENMFALAIISAGTGGRGIVPAGFR